ncbi:FecR domain-containing protein [Achromobacter sp. Marseille-Q0513]|uniref:FecR family protein n=1 Tax=Achromobacter sp. Marseille-Q0513 TaxID=2829161 RepID=UPI001B92C951|nr:FecR domain-containing protein [Achromobacter sp. Marseille-Q0513]MBR8653595.1 FecR domain-containing protein [Achromobacter sp. Marseille-Q0513]
MSRNPAAVATDEALAEQAAEWIVRLSDGDEAERLREREAFEAWKRADPRHAAAASGMERMVGQLRSARADAGGNGRPARAGLDASFAGQRRRGRVKRAAAAIALALLLAGPAWIALRAWPPGYLLADVHTATGQWESRRLADGSQIWLNSASAVNLRYDERRRVIELVQGEILVDVAKDAGRPFLVETAHGSIRALGTRFVVNRQSDATILSMLESRVAVRTASQRADSEAIEVSAGQRVRITAASVSRPQEIDARGLADAWQRHQLVIDDQPLDEVLDELARHRPGHIHYERAEVRGMRVSAVLPLDDTDRALKLLSTSFPSLRIRTVTPWLVLVDAPPPSH